MSERSLTMLGRMMMQVDKLRSVISVQKKDLERVESARDLIRDENCDLRVTITRLRKRYEDAPSPWEVENLRSDLARFKTLHDQQRIRIEDLTKELNSYKHPSLAACAKEVYDADPVLIRQTKGFSTGGRTENYESDHKLIHVKLVRSKSGCGLKEAYDAVTAFYESEYRNNPRARLDAPKSALGDLIKAKLGSG